MPDERAGLSVTVVQVMAVLDPAAGGLPASAVAAALALKPQCMANDSVSPVKRGREHAVSNFVETLQAHDVRVHSFTVPGVLDARAGLSARRSNENLDRK